MRTGIVEPSEECLNRKDGLAMKTVTLEPHCDQGFTRQGSMLIHLSRKRELLRGKSPDCGEH